MNQNEYVTIVKCYDLNRARTCKLRIDDRKNS